MTRLRIISRTTWVLLCGAAVLTTAAFLACGQGPIPMGSSNTSVGTSVGTSININLNQNPNSTAIGTDSTTTTTTPPTEADGGNCGITSNSLTKQPADLLLVLDKTGSLTRAMDAATECPAGSTTCQQRWTTLTSGLNTVLSASSTDVNWGLQLFNSDGSCGVAATPEVPIAPGAAATVQTTIAGVTPNGSTPTRKAIDAAVAYMKTLTDTNGKYILLATDGEPNCGSTSGGRGGGGSGASDVTNTVTAIQTAAAAGFKVYVLGVGVETGNLDNFAIAGGTDHYYPALSPQDLNAALATIVGAVASCVFNLGKVPPDPSNVAVEFNNDPNLKAPQDTTHANGWDYTSSAHTTVQLYGSWCDNVTNGTYTTYKVLMGCLGGVDVRR